MARRKQTISWQRRIGRISKLTAERTATRRSIRILSQRCDAPVTAILKPLEAPSTPRGGKRARLQDCSDELAENLRPAKRRQNVSSPPQALSSKNLRKHDKMTESDTFSGSIKRSSSQRSLSTRTDVTQVTVLSQGSSGTLARYRHTHLKRARVYVRSRPPPEPIHATVNTIINTSVSAQRTKELAAIRDELCDNFTPVLESAAGEDDCVELLHTALTAMDGSKRLKFPRKADWQQSLKPRIQPSSWNLEDVMGDMLDEAERVDSPQSPPPKRPSRNSPAAQAKTRTAQDDMPAPATTAKIEPKADSSPIKTPRPDISIGLRTVAVVDALVSHDMNTVAANDFLDYLQQTFRRNTVQEPLLCSEPTQRSLNLRFPFLVIEGKSYATGKPIYEAQNQAAVSGACALKILLDLVQMAARVENGSSSPGPDSAQSIVFSVCTEGPHHELWVHYTTTEHGVRMFNMSILKTCHISLPDGVLDFLVVLDRVLTWGASVFLDGVVGRLAKMAKRARTP